MITKDIETREDIVRLLESFYVEAIGDKEIGHHFAKLDLEKHLPIIANFWEKILFGSPVYFGNPLLAHKILNEISPLKPEHFVRWVGLFQANVNSMFSGEIADKANNRAEMIARTLSLRLNENSFAQENIN